jgi:hypothetical protein
MDSSNKDFAARGAIARLSRLASGELPASVYPITTFNTWANEEEVLFDALAHARDLRAILALSPTSGGGAETPTIEPMFWDWLLARDLCPDPDADGTVDWLDIINALNDHENELLSAAPSSPEDIGGLG